MPELPEIETIRNGLRRFILNQEIDSFLLRDKKLNLSSANLKFIKSNSFSEVERVGKMLVFPFSSGDFRLLIHLKMTGQLVFCPRNNKIAVIGGHSDKKSSFLDCGNFKHIRLEIVFKSGDRLLLNDTRRFAYIKLVNTEEFLKIKERFGLEPVNEFFSWNDFKKIILSRPNKNIKAFLLDQSLIAGIGNIYADEILFASSVSPFVRVSDLSSIQVKIIFLNIKRILKLAVKKRGTTFSDYITAEGESGGFLKMLKVYGRTGANCKKCSGPIKKVKVAGRGTHYCPKCQG
ncbi:MAG: DNA-formamidopyrimidine glycosylase [Patescibacteria group bacterium]|nr:DNA-formamidopyrimidine glycosylase [Patescibacteria group bacterium]